MQSLDTSRAPAPPLLISLITTSLRLFQLTKQPKVTFVTPRVNFAGTDGISHGATRFVAVQSPRKTARAPHPSHLGVKLWKAF